MSNNLAVWSFVNILVLTFFTIWTYSITKLLIEKNKYDSSLKFNPFKIQLIITNIYIVAFLLYLIFTNGNIEEPKWMLLIIIMGHFFLSWNIFYFMRFIAKSISTVEFKRECHFSDYLGNMVLLVFFPIGIWWLHPKIQTLIKA